jgi:predicted amidohydrolase
MMSRVGEGQGTSGQGGRRSVRVAAVQLAARGAEAAAAALEDSLDAVARAAADGAQLVVLPECTWPAYALGADWRELWAALPPQDDVLAAYAGAARQHGVVLVVGLALRDDDTLRNMAVVWERDGTEAGRAAKRFLWDFDSRCFTAGTASPVIATSLGRLGVMVCADGRMPEIARLLAVGGAEILLDPTAWVTGQGDPRTWTNPQYEFMLPTRARENGLAAVAANKVGIERDAVAYCGRSCVLDRAGGVVAAAPPDEPAVLIADCDLGPAAPPVARRPTLYGHLTRALDELPASVGPREAIVPSTASGRVAVDALQRPLAAADARLLADLGAALLVSPRPVAGELSLPVVARTDRDTAVLQADGHTVARWQRTHGADAPGTALGPVVGTPLGRLGVLIGADGELPEPARVLMLEGAELLVWFAEAADDVRATAATRAAENRLNVVLAPGFGAAAATAVLDPDGGVVATAGAHARLVHAVLSLAEVRRKEMAPGTDVVAGRQPGGYELLVAAAAPAGGYEEGTG